LPVMVAWNSTSMAAFVRIICSSALNPVVPLQCACATSRQSESRSPASDRTCVCLIVRTPEDITHPCAPDAKRSEHRSYRDHGAQNAEGLSQQRMTQRVSQEASKQSDR